LRKRIKGVNEKYGKEVDEGKEEGKRSV